MLVAREVKLEGFGTHKVYIALCLVNHMIIGIAENKHDALDNMLTEFNEMMDEEDDHLKGIDLEN